jgi:asparagine synthase (glutamine-hydrolysing)
MELAARIPSSIKFRGRRKKYILKRALEPLLPRDILDRRKAGFNVPVGTWLHGELGVKARAVLSPDRLAASGFFRPDVVRALLDAHASRREDHSFAIWGLLCFQLWYERFVASPSVAPPRDVAARWNINPASSRAGTA